MEQVKFFSGDVKEVESAINSWLQEQKRKIIRVLQSQNAFYADNVVVVSIYYVEESKAHM